MLVVDDDQAIRSTVSELLEDEGYQVLGAANGLEALGVIRAAKSPPCIVLLDLMMPVMNGMEFLDAVREDEAIASTVVVIVSAITDRLRTELTRYVPPVADRLQKPVKLERLLAIVAQHCPPESAAHG